VPEEVKAAEQAVPGSGAKPLPPGARSQGELCGRAPAQPPRQRSTALRPAGRWHSGCLVDVPWGEQGVSTRGGELGGPTDPQPFGAH